MKKNIGILADSSAGLSQHDIKNFPNLVLCPLLIIYNDNETIEDDPSKFDIQTELLSDQDFVKKLTIEKLVAKTSQTPLGLMMQIWEKMLLKYEQIIFIPISKGLSGQYNTACMLAKEPQFKNKVFVFDSNGVSSINWFIVKKACYLSEKENTKVDAILPELQKIADNSYAFILPRDINYLARGGRISKAAATLAKSLKLQPILSYDGTIDKFDTTRTFKRALHKVVNEIQKQEKANKKKLQIILAHGFSSEEEVKEIVAYLQSYDLNVIDTCRLAKVICAHTGIGTISLVLFNLLPSEL